MHSLSQANSSYALMPDVEGRESGTCVQVGRQITPMQLAGLVLDAHEDHADDDSTQRALEKGKEGSNASVAVEEERIVKEMRSG